MLRSVVDGITPHLVAAGIDPALVLPALVSVAVFFTGGWGLYRLLKPAIDWQEERAWGRNQKRIDDLRRMSWQEFERYAALVFERGGWQVTITGGGGADNGVDLILRRGPRVKVIVQCKHYKSRVGVGVLREAVGVAYHYKAKGVYVVALKGFTKSAIEYADGKPIKLVDGAAMLSFMGRGHGN